MKDAYQTYEAVRVALTRGKRPSSIRELPRFIPDFEGKSNDVLLQELLGTVFDPDVLFDFLSARFERLIVETRKKGRLRDGQLSWNAGIHGGVAQLAYERTRQVRFLDLYIDFHDKILEFRDDVRGQYDDFHGRVMTSWGVAGETAVIDAGFGIWVSHVTHFGVIMQPATGFARLIHEDPALSKYREFADRVVADFAVGYREFDFDLRHLPGTDEVWYWRPLKLIYEPTNHMHLVGESLLNMYAITGDEFYADRIRSFIRTFEKSARIDRRGFVAWDYHPYFAQSGRLFQRRQKSEVTWKASHTVPFVYAALKDGFSVDRGLVDAMTKTIREHVVANNDYASNLNPKGSVPFSKRRKKREGPEHSKVFTIAGFLAASDEDPRIKDLIVNTVVTRRDMFPDGWLNPAERASHTKGPLAYAFMLGDGSGGGGLDSASAG